MLLNSITHIDYTNLQLIRQNSEINWLNVISLLLCISLIISSKMISSDSISSIIGLKKEKTQTTKGLPSYFLSLNYFIVITLYIWNYYITTNDANHLYSLFIIFSIVIGISYIKLLTIYLIGTFFKRKDHFHLKLHLKFYKLLGVLLLPLYVLTYFFTPENLLFAYIFIAILSLLLLITREILSLFAALNNRISLLYIILYLCTLELLPIALVTKLFMS